MKTNRSEKLSKLRVFEEDKILMDGSHVKVLYMVSLWESSLITDKPLLHAAAIVKKHKKYLLKGNPNNYPQLPPTLYGELQMSLIATFRRTLAEASPEQIANFKNGHYLELQAHVP